MSLFKKEPTRGASGESFTRRQLLEDLYLTKNALDTAYANLEAVVDPDLIDCCIYRGNAAWKRYQFLIREVKQTQMGT